MNIQDIPNKKKKQNLKSIKSWISKPNNKATKKSTNLTRKKKAAPKTYNSTTMINLSPYKKISSLNRNLPFQINPKPTAIMEIKYLY